MRALSADEIYGVAGGDLDEVVVRGRRIPRSSLHTGGMPSTSWVFEFSSGENNQRQPSDDVDRQETPRDTPCVTDKPKEVAVIDLHQAALDLKALERSSAGSPFENFAFLFRMPGSSEVHATRLFNDRHIASIGVYAVGAAADALPPNAIIVGIFHSDPFGSTMSQPDWRTYMALFGNPGSPGILTASGIVAAIGRGITADANGLSYVYNKQTGKVHVYDKSDVGSDKPQCHVNGK